ncbi:MAG: cardiolipin synthase [[Clostridium] fimetarium]|nr:cardiolipin synthase [Alistipes timonensis]MCM1406267.1 cardiolipin synthase [[Clostridium] fimetarium]
MNWFEEVISNPWVWYSVSTLYALIILSIICVVVSENRNPVKTLAWVTVLLVAPVVGLVLYIFFGRNIQGMRVISRKNRRKLRRLDGSGRVSSADLPRSRHALQQIRLASSLCGSDFYPANAAEIFDNGADKFDSLLRDIASARSFINMEYYIVADDRIGTRVADALIERARAGVKVRLLYDHVGSFKVRRRFFRRLEEAGVESTPFFKVVFPPFGTRINWRNHRKICVIDGEIGYIGGMNIADRYVDGGKFASWRDTHIRVTGPAVLSLEKAFAIDWTFTGHPLIDDPHPAPRPIEGSTMGMQLITGGPTSHWLNITLVFQKAISVARKCVYIQTPYFLPTEGLLHSLQMAALAKIDVRVMLPARSDSDMLRWASNSYVSECLKAGIKVYFYEKGMLHSKVLIVDDEFATVGSANFDFRSFEHNFEANMLVYSQEFNERIKKQFLRDQRGCRRVNPNRWRHRPLPEKALESFMRLFAPIL